VEISRQSHCIGRPSTADRKPSVIPNIGFSDMIGRATRESLKVRSIDQKIGVT
jgi:hypothetical protein